MTTDRQMAVDAVAVLVVSVAILVASDRLVLMTVLVPVVWLARLVLFVRWSPPGRRPGVEAAFLILCTLLGGFNDWMSVVHHRVYDYAVPVFSPDLTTIPFWMLLFWGLVLRSVASFAWWRGLDPGAAPSNRVGFGPLRRDSAPLRVALQLALVLGTRQVIYRTHDDPLWSWLPFAAALGLYALLFGLDRADRRLALAFAVGGPLVEVLYIQLGGLHRYHLGWLGGVPLWIALWWVLAVLIWKDLSPRLLRLLRLLQNWMVRSRWPSSVSS